MFGLKNKVPDKAIVAVTEDQLGITTRQLIKAGCKEILVEKPGGFDIKDIKSVATEAKNIKPKFSWDTTADFMLLP